MWGLISSRAGKVDPDGFLARFYKIMLCVTPVLGCGLLGCADDDYVDMCSKFKARRLHC